MPLIFFYYKTFCSACQENPPPSPAPILLTLSSHSQRRRGGTFIFHPYFFNVAVKHVPFPAVFRPTFLPSPKERPTANDRPSRKALPPASRRAVVPGGRPSAHPRKPAFSASFFLIFQFFLTFRSFCRPRIALSRRLFFRKPIARSEIGFHPSKKQNHRQKTDGFERRSSVKICQTPASLRVAADKPFERGVKPFRLDGLGEMRVHTGRKRPFDVLVEDVRRHGDDGDGLSVGAV